MLPLSLEMMDALIINAVEDSYACGYPRDAAAVLIIEVEGSPAGLKGQAGAARELCMKNGCRDIHLAKDDAERNRLWDGRRDAFGAVANLAPQLPCQRLYRAPDPIARGPGQSGGDLKQV